MKNEMIFNAVGQIDDVLIQEAVSDAGASVKDSKTAKLSVLKVILPVAAAALLAAGIGFAVLSTKGPDNIQPEPVTVADSGEIAEAKHWEDMKPFERYSEFTYQGTRYSLTGAVVSEDRLGSALLQTTATGFDPYGGKEAEGKIMTVSGTVFAIQGVSPEAAAAIKLEGYEGAYAALNPSCEIATFGEFADALGLENELSFSAAYEEYVKIGAEKKAGMISYEIGQAAESAALYGLIFSESNRNAALVSEEGHSRDAVLSFSTNVPLLGIGNKAFTLYPDGTVTTNILMTGRRFEIGGSAVQEIVDYVKTHFEGRETVYEAPKDGGMPEGAVVTNELVIEATQSASETRGE